MLLPLTMVSRGYSLQHLPWTSTKLTFPDEFPDKTHDSYMLSKKQQTKYNKLKKNLIKINNR